jgi:hypothetical protein
VIESTARRCLGRAGDRPRGALKHFGNLADAAIR